MEWIWLFHVLRIFWNVVFCRDEYDSDASEASEDDQQPMTRSQLMSRAMKSVKKREAAMKKQGFQYDLSEARDKTKKKDKSKGK